MGWRPVRGGRRGPTPSFEVGAAYRVRCSFRAERAAFREGELLVYWRYGASFYDGMQGWFFICADGSVRPWDIPTSESGAQWSDLFERVTPPDVEFAAAAKRVEKTTRKTGDPSPDMPALVSAARRAIGRVGA